MINVSIVILTKNEQQDLPGCLESVSWSDDVHVFDSCSSDDTVRIATEFGANVTQRLFDDWSTHQNWGLANISFKHQWVLYIDADERVTAGLVGSIRAAVSKPDKFVAFRIRRRDFFMGTWLKHVQASPYYIRLFRPEYMRYERLVNPVSIVDGPVGELDGHIDHYPFSKGIAHWIDRHNSYSTFEASQISRDRSSRAPFNVWKALFGADFHQRRFHQKELFFRLPFRPIVKFFILYCVRLGFLDGYAGLNYAILQSIYEYFIVMKTRASNVGGILK